MIRQDKRYAAKLAALRILLGAGLVLCLPFAARSQVNWGEDYGIVQFEAPPVSSTPATTSKTSSQNNYTQCTPSRNEHGQIAVQCPNGQNKRDDINPQCIRNQNKNTCLNTMPVSGSVARIPEDLCYRGEGWKKKRDHSGVDYAVTIGTPVTAAADGVVTMVNDCAENAGRLVKIVHKKSASAQAMSSGSDAYTTIYMHLSKISVSIGQQVKKGQQIGLSGDSNCIGTTIYENGAKCKNSDEQCSYGAHLHFEMRDGDATHTNQGHAVLDPLCSGIQTLCEEKSSNPFYANQSGSGYDTSACRDCNKNAQSCQASHGELDSSTQAPSELPGDCVTLYPEDNLLMLAATGESGNDAGRTNWYSKHNGCYGNTPDTIGADKGGCSYGFVQMACGSTAGGKVSTGDAGSFRTFMTRLYNEKPELYKKLAVGKDLDETIKFACNDQAYPEENAAFRAAWESLGSNRDFYNLQYSVNYDEYVVRYAQTYARNAGLDWNSLSPEIQMTFASASVAAPGLCQKMINSLVGTFGTDLNSNLEAVIKEAAIIRTLGYKNYLGTKAGDATYKAAEARAKKDIERTLTSAKIRQAIKESENPPSKYHGMSPNEIAIEVTGKRLCEEGEMPVDYTPGSNKNSEVVSSAAQAASSMIAASGSQRDCSVKNYRSSFSSCIFCDVFRILFNTASLLVKYAYDALVNGIFNLVLVGTALWVAFTILSYVSSFETKDPRNLTKTLLNQGFVVMVVLILLKTDSNYFMSLVLEPVFNTGLALGKLAMSSGGATCSDESIKGIKTAAEGGGIPPSMGINILCLIDAIQGKLLDLMSVGSASICVGVYIKSWFGIPIFPHFGYLITGLLLWIAALMLLIMYPWLLVDAVLQMCVASIMVPVAIGAYAFKKTRDMIVGKVWQTFMNAMFNFMFLAIVLAILLKALDKVTAEAFNRSLTEAGGSNSFREILSSIAWWSINLLKLIFIMLLGWSVLGESKKFADKFASGIKTEGIGTSVGTLAASGLRGVATKASGTALNAAGKGMSMVRDTAREKYNDFRVANQARTMRNRMNNAARYGTANADGTLSYRNKFGRKFTVNADGSGYSYRTLLGKTVTKTTTKNANGQSVINITRTSRSGKSTTVSNDGWIKSTVKKDKDGKIIGQHTQMMTAAGRALINKDGSINTVALNNIMRNSGQDAQTTKLAIMEQLMKERFRGLNLPDMKQDFRNRSLVSSVDDQGREVFTLRQLNKDGSQVNMSITFGAGNERILTELETISTFRKDAVKYSSDGIINKSSSYRYKNGGIDRKSVKNSYSFTQYYNKLYGKGMNSLGQIDNRIPSGQILFSAEDLADFQNQVANYGQQAPLSGFK